MEFLRSFNSFRRAQLSLIVTFLVLCFSIVGTATPSELSDEGRLADIKSAIKSIQETDLNAQSNLTILVNTLVARTIYMASEVQVLKEGVVEIRKLLDLEKPQITLAIVKALNENRVDLGAALVGQLAGKLEVEAELFPSLKQPIIEFLMWNNRKYSWVSEYLRPYSKGGDTFPKRKCAEGLIWASPQSF
jgi:hypothetical protein